MTIFKKLYKKATVFLTSFLFVSISLGMLGGETTTNLQDGFYKIRNIDTMEYVTISDVRTGTPTWGQDLKMQPEITSGDKTYTQIFKITRDGDWHKILGTLNNNYTTGTKVFDVGGGTVYFCPTDYSNAYQKIKLTANIMTPILARISCEQYGPEKFLGIESGKLVLDKPNNRFAFIQTQQPPPPSVMPFQNGDLVTIKSFDGRYFQMPISPISAGYYQGSFQARNTNNPGQIFKIKRYANNEISFIGTINGDYTGANAGLLRTAGVYSARFDVNKTTPGSDNLFLLFSQGENSFSILNKKFNKLEAKANTLLKDTNEPLNNPPAAAIFTIEKYTTPAPPPVTPTPATTTPVTPFNDGELVTIKSSNGIYYQMSDNNQGQFYYNKLSKPNQTFRIKRNADNTYSFIGTVNENPGMLQSSPSYAKFILNKTTPDKENKFSLYSKGGNSFVISSNNKYQNIYRWALKDTDLQFNNLPTTAIFTIEKYTTPAPPPVTPTPATTTPVTPFNDGELVTIKSSNGIYYQMSDNNQGQFYYNKLSKPNQTFRIKRNADNTYSFIGTVNENPGMLQSSPSYAKFILNKTTPDKENKFSLYSKGGNSFVISSNNKYQNIYRWALKDTDLQFNNLPTTAIFTIEKYTTPAPPPVTPTPATTTPVTPFQSGKFVSIKDSATGKYMELTTETAYTSVAGRYGVKFGSTTLNKPTQIFKVMVSGNNIGFIGSINNNYTGNNAGLLNPHWIGQNSHFFKNTYTLSGYRIFQLFKKGTNLYGLFNVQHQKFENASTENKLIEINNTLANLPSTAIFEIKETTQREETPTPGPTEAQVIAKLLKEITTLRAQIQEQRNIKATLMEQMQQQKQPTYQTSTSRYSRGRTPFGGTTTSRRSETTTRPTTRTRYQTRGRR